MRADGIAKGFGTRLGVRSQSDRTLHVVNMLKDVAKAHLVGCCVSCLTACLMLWTEPKLAIHWDEGYTLGRDEALRDWFEALRDPPRFAAEWKRRSPAD